MNRVEKQEERMATKRMRNLCLHCPTRQLREKLDICFVVIRDNHKDLEIKFLQLISNFVEMFSQSCTVQSDHWSKANKVTVASGQRADQKRKQGPCWPVIFVAEEASTTVVDSLGCVDLRMLLESVT